MTPKQKAKELYDKYLVYASDLKIEMRERTAKECSLFCVKQILNHTPQYGTYWVDVQNELNKI